jgi:dCMP deaminase
MLMAYQASVRATCEEAQVGCVLTNSSYAILATGYNGVLPGQPECSGKNVCKVSRNSSSGHQAYCPTIHAEVNALHQYFNLHRQVVLPVGSKAFVTAAPCYSCLQQLYLAGVREIYFHRQNSWVEGYISHPSLPADLRIVKVKLANHQLTLP